MARAVRFTDHGGRQVGPRDLDAAIAELAERQHGVVARTQLLALGLSLGEIEYRVRRDRLHSIHRGVYAVGHRLLSWKGRCMAAVLTVGEGAVVSHRTAAALWDIRRSASTLLEVTFERNIERPGISSHRAKLVPDEVTLLDSIPVTTPHRTLLDLAVMLDRGPLARALERTDALRLTDPLPLAALLRRHRGRAGTRSLREVLARNMPAHTRSELEDAFLTFLDAHRLPRPDVNVIVEAFEVDFVWRDARLVVELDGYESHGTRQAFERDRARDRALQAAGWRVIRVTWRQLHAEARTLARDLRQARLALRG